MYACIYMLSEDDTDVCLYIYLLPCANELPSYSKCAYLYIQMWCTVVGYSHDANCLHYLQESGHNS